MIPSLSNAGSQVNSMLVSDTSPIWNLDGCPGTKRQSRVTAWHTGNVQQYTTACLVHLCFYANNVNFKLLLKKKETEN